MRACGVVWHVFGPTPVTGHLSDRDIARATGAAASTVGAWIRGTRSPRGDRAERLAPGYIPVWLQRPVPALDDEKPIELIARGDYLRVARLVSSLEEPGAA